MYSVNQIKAVHLEISSRCNASCPLCPRNFYGFPFNDGYVEHDMTLDEAKKIFKPTFIQQLQAIYINGNFGDAVMNPDTVAIVQWFKSLNPKVEVRIGTNGGARDAEFWTALAQTGAIINFCIDGLEDTHSIYRRNTKFDVVIKNACTVIAAGGYATWKMIEFDHNRHQIDAAKKLSEELGFAEFMSVDYGRNQGPVYNKKGEIVYVMGNPAETDFNKLYNSRRNDDVQLEDIIANRVPCEIDCRVKKNKNVYITAIGEVYPCCWLGFNPKTYGHGTYHQAANQQFRHLIGENNALTHDLADCISWFNRIEETWNIPTFDQGRLVICNDVCGQKR